MPKQMKPLTRKQTAFVKELLENPKQSATQAALKTYNTTSIGTAQQIAHDNLSKPNVVSALGEVNELLENTLINTVKDWGRSDNSRQREIAQNAVMYAHDKIHGKAKQSIETTTTGVTLTIDLTSALDVEQG